MERYFEKKKRAFEVAVRRNEEGAKAIHFELTQYDVSGVKHEAAKLEAEDPPPHHLDCLHDQG